MEVELKVLMMVVLQVVTLILELFMHMGVEEAVGIMEALLVKLVAVGAVPVWALLQALLTRTAAVNLVGMGLAATLEILILEAEVEGQAAMVLQMRTVGSVWTTLLCLVQL